MLYWTDHFGKRWPVCSCLQKWLPAYQAESLRRGLIRECIDVFQTIGGYAKSSGTHATGGAADTAQYSEAQVALAREMGAAAWHRTPEQGFIHHCHLVLNGCPHAADSAKGQVLDYKRGWNGLVGKSRRQESKTARSLRTWSQGIEWAQAPAKPAPAAETVAIAWSQWKWTAPYGDPDEVLYPALAKFENRPYFARYPEGVVFRAPVGGATTHGSSYPRSELREMNGKNKVAWFTNRGDHNMILHFAVTTLPGRKPHVVVAQIHDAADDVVMIRLEGTRLYLEESLGKGKGSKKRLLDANYRLGSKKRIKIRATGGVIRVRYGVFKSIKIPKIASGCYYKAGCYTQADSENGTGYGEVVIYSLTVTHKW